MSSYSTTSKFSDNRSRPASYAFPAFHSSLPYALVRDFAYPIAHPWHYGPPLETPEGPSGTSTPASERPRRLSDPANTTWDGANPQWSAGPWGGDGFFANQQLPQMAYGDGPPYSEDEDLQSPVVVSSRHKKSKSLATTSTRHERGRMLSPGQGLEEEDEDDALHNDGGRQGYFPSANGDFAERHFLGNGDEVTNGVGGGLVTYPPDQLRQSLLAPNTYAAPGQRDSHFATTLPNRSYMQAEPDEQEEESSARSLENDSRYSKDYQFTIASPDEEMHGKAVALFDFARENENELPLAEGQIIWVSYRNGQGWLVAEDPKTGDKGLVPEEYVRLLKDIEGGWSSLSGEQAEDEQIPDSPVAAAAVSETVGSPNLPDPTRTHSATDSNGSNGTGEKRPPIVSTFSTSSKDLNPYPHNLLGTQTGSTPPQVVHYGSQSSTPTVTSPVAGSHGLRGFAEIMGPGEEKSDNVSGAEARDKKERKR